jgi:voltage-gated potassium channel
VILATNDDMANLEIALDARRLKPDIRVICRMFDQNMADKVRDGFDIRLAMSQSAISAPAFAMAAIDPSIINSFVVGNQLVVMQRWTVKSGGPMHDRTIAEVMHELGCSVVELGRGSDGSKLFPSPTIKLVAGDELVLQGPYENVARLRRKSGRDA